MRVTIDELIDKERGVAYTAKEGSLVRLEKDNTSN